MHIPAAPPCTTSFTFLFLSFAFQKFRNWIQPFLFIHSNTNLLIIVLCVSVFVEFFIFKVKVFHSWKSHLDAVNETDYYYKITCEICIFPCGSLIERVNSNTDFPFIISILILTVLSHQQIQIVVMKQTYEVAKKVKQMTIPHSCRRLFNKLIVRSD